MIPPDQALPEALKAADESESPLFRMLAGEVRRLTVERDDWKARAYEAAKGMTDLNAEKDAALARAESAERSESAWKHQCEDAQGLWEKAEAKVERLRQTLRWIAGRFCHGVSCVVADTNGPAERCEHQAAREVLEALRATEAKP